MATFEFYGAALQMHPELSSLLLPPRGQDTAANRLQHLGILTLGGWGEAALGACVPPAIVE
jgi:hypothetical protein